MTGFTLALIVVLGEGALFDTERPVSHMTTNAAITRPGTETFTLTFLVAVFADLIASIIDAVCVCSGDFCGIGVHVFVWCALWIQWRISA